MMVNVPTPEFQKLWSNLIESLRLEYENFIQHPDCDSVMERVSGVLTAIAHIAGCTPASAGESPKWALIVHNMGGSRGLRQLLKVKQLYSALYGVYIEVLHDLTAVLKDSAAKGETTKITITAPPSIKEFHEQRRLKRKPTKPTIVPRSLTTSITGVNDLQLQSKSQVPTRNFFAPLRSTEMGADHGDDADDTTERQLYQAPYSQTGRPLPIVLISEIKPIQLQRQMKGFLKGNVEFRNSRNGTRIVMKEMEDFSAIRFHFESNNLPHFTFSLKSQKSIKAVTRHLPFSTPAEDISGGMVNLGSDVISVNYNLSITCKGTTTVNIPLFLIISPRTPGSLEIFKLTSLCHIAIKVEEYKAQTGVTQCYNGQQFGYVWANCKQPPRCMWYGGDRLLHKECPEKRNTTSIPTCCS
jgi:hypothetical protein